MSSKLEQWICIELSKLLGSDASEDIAGYLVTFESEHDLKEYVSDLLNPKVPRHQRFIDQLIERWRPPQRKIDGAIPDNVTIYKKSEDVEHFVSGIEKDTKGGKKKEKKSSDSTNSMVNGVSKMKLKEAPVLHNKNLAQPMKGVVKKSPKFVPLFSEEGHAKSAAKLPGRYPCDCLATKHNLINNCMQCGRIVCEQEGSGPCLFCQHLVCTREEQEVLARGSKKSEKLRQQLMEKYSGSSKSLPAVAARMKQGLEKALENKERLLDYDRTSVRRTQVIDDESDYFSTDSRWLNSKEKDMLSKREEELRAKKYASRKDRKITLDFAGRKVINAEDTVDVYNVNDSVVQEVHYGGKSAHASQPAAEFNDGDFTDLVNPDITRAPPVFVESQNWSKAVSQTNGTATGIGTQKTSRIQDREMLEMSDEGMCLSMHQPWALLLVKGIKIHEGRSWYTPHRGRLWIAATSKTPTPQEIAEVEQQYRHHYRDSDIDFPKDYPAGCLLGSIDLVDCLGQEEYSQKYPDGESGSPYVFICENPLELVLKFPLKGKHKIYKLDHHFHQAAKKGLKKS